MQKSIDGIRNLGGSVLDLWGHVSSFNKSTEPMNDSVVGKVPRADVLARGVMEEDKLHYGATVEAYESMIEEFNRMRPRAANAIFRLAEVNRKLGKEDEARKHYMRILQEFSDFKELASISQMYSGGERRKGTDSPDIRLDWMTSAYRQ